MTSDLQLLKKHLYVVRPGGTPAPGVTSIIDLLDKPGMVWSAAKMAAEAAMRLAPEKEAVIADHRRKLNSYPYGRIRLQKMKSGSEETGESYEDAIFANYCRDEARRQWDAKASIGTRVHNLAARKATGQKYRVTNQLAPYAEALEAFYEDHDPRAYAVEKPVGYARLKSDAFDFGGTPDWVGWLDDDGDGYGTILDIKTGGEHLETVGMQLVAYGYCAFIRYDAKGMVEGMDRIPTIANYRALYLSPEGYRLVNPFEIVQPLQALAAFMSLRSVWNYRVAMDDAS